MQPPGLRARALRLLTLREHSRAELERKLLRPRTTDTEPPDPRAVAALLDQLQAEGWLDEARFAASLVRRRSAKYGAARIARELQTHGLDPELARAALAASMPDLDAETAAALAALRRRHPQPPTTTNERARQQRFLAARGFSAAAQRQALRQHAEAAADDPPADDDPGYAW